MSELTQRIKDRIENTHEMSWGKSKKWTFTLEAGRGSTYASGKPTLYAHSTYEKQSVNAGQPQRVFMEQWDDWTAAREALAEVKKNLPKFKVQDRGPDGGSSHVPISVITAHLPDAPDNE